MMMLTSYECSLLAIGNYIAANKVSVHPAITDLHNCGNMSALFLQNPVACPLTTEDVSF